MPVIGPGGRSSRAGDRLIIGYKAIKGSLQLLVALAMALVPWGALSAALVRIALVLQEHVSARWAYLIQGVVDGATPSRLKLAFAALAADGLFTLLEGWSLWRGKRWAPWFVVVATGGLIPVEIGLLIEHPTVLRVVLLIVNAATVAYLVRSRLHSAHAADADRNRSGGGAGVPAGRGDGAGDDRRALQKPDPHHAPDPDGR